MVTGRPRKNLISTSHVERSNLSFPMRLLRYTRLTSGHSKKFEPHCHMVALRTVWYKYPQINKAVKMAPAMAAGVSKMFWTMNVVVALIDATASARKSRGPYKRRLEDAVA